MPELVTDEEKLEALLKFRQEQILGGKTQAAFADMGLCTVYKIVWDLGATHTDQQADVIEDQIADHIVHWLQHEQDVWTQQFGVKKLPERRLPVGDGLSVGKKKNIRLTPDGNTQPKGRIVHLVEYDGSIQAIDINPNRFDEAIFKDLCELYSVIACEIGPYPALIVVGNYQWHATIRGNGAEFTRQELGVTSIPTPMKS